MSLDRVVTILASWPECLQGIEYPTNHLASWLDIQLSVWSILTGHALELLLCEPCDGSPFPMVCTVSLILSSDEYGDSTEDNLSAIDVNVSAFVVRLSAMVPMANEIRLEGGRTIRNLSLRDSEQMVRLASYLCQRYKRVTHNVDYKGSFSGRRLDMIRDLVHFEYSAKDGYEKVLRVVRQNASTLKTLTIKFKHVINVSGLIRDEDGGFVNYPRLQRLELGQTRALRQKYKHGKILPWWTRRNRTQRPVFPDVVPFPELQCLCIEMEYPFGDDTLFRGNAGTLAYLDIVLYYSLLEVIFRYDMFTPVSHPKLRCVKTHEVCNVSTWGYSIGAGVLQTVREIAPHALVRTIGGIKTSNFMAISYSTFKQHTSVRVLYLPDTQPEIRDVLDVFGQLPNLVELCTGPLNFKHLACWASINVDTPAYLHTVRILAGRQFRIWNFASVKQVERADLVSSLQMMARMCFAFDCVSRLAALERFVSDNYADNSTVNWKLAGTYMSIDALECQRVGLDTFNNPINKVGYRRIREFRDSGLSWKDVYQHFMQYPNEISLQNRYYWLKTKPNRKKTKRLTTEWTDVERERMKDLIEQHMESTARSKLVDFIKQELPNRPLCDIRLFSCQYVHKIKAGRMSLDQMTQLRELVGEYGEEWDRIGKVLDVLPSKARYCWSMYGGNVGKRFALSSDETRQLQHLVGSGVKYKEAAKLLGIVSPQRYYYKPTQLTSIDDETLLKMIDASTRSTTAKWEQASKVLGRSVIACKQRLSDINRGRKFKQVMNNRESLVTSEVQ
ncbi:hypothetical protein IW146_008715, partial [Coemansia sp. RSA 922]